MKIRQGNLEGILAFVCDIINSYALFFQMKNAIINKNKKEKK